MKKKLIYIIALILVVAGIITFFVLQDKIKIVENNNTNSQTIGTRSSNEIVNTNNENEEKKQSKKIEQSDGTLYTFSDEEEKADIVIGDNYYDTQISDIMYNIDLYKGKTIEIEGMYLDSSPYTFVGRYSTSSLCPYCPQGYSYFEFVWDGEKIKLEDEKTWLKIIGTICIGNDETTNYQDYYYIQASSVEVMNERGIDTVNN